ETVTIVRGEGRKGGVVRLETPQGRREGQEAVDALLHASEELFRNVYAFTLDELQDAASLKEEAVRGRMYGAGLGLGRVSLDEVEKGFRQRCEALFKPRGANPLMNRLAQEAKGLQSQIQDLQQDLGRFEALDTQAAKLAQESRALETSIGEHEESLRQLDLRLRLYEPFVDLERVRGQLEEMGDVPAFPETAFQLHEDLQKDLRRYRRQFEEERDRLAKWRAEVQALRFSPALLDRAGDVATVRGMLSQVNAAIADQRPLELERSRLDDQIQVDIKAAGLTWDEKRVREFQLSEGDLEDVRELGQSRARLGQKRDAVKSKLEFHREQKAAARLRGMAVPSWLRAFVWVVLSFGLAGTGAGAALGDPNVLGIAVGVLILGGFLLFKTYRRAADFQMDDPVEAHLLKEHKMSVMEYEAKLEEWDRWLEAHDLKEGVSGYLTPNKMEPLRQRVRGIQERIREREDLDARLRQMRDKVEEARTRMQDLSGCVDGVRPAGEIAAADLATQMNLVCLTFDQHRQKRDQRLTLEAKIAEQEAKVAHISEYIAAGEDARQKLFLSADAGSEEEFLERRRRAERRRELETKFAGCKKEIELGAGVGPAFDAFVASLRERPRLDWEGQREQTSTALAALKDQRDAMNQAIGHLRAERERLASGDALLARQSELEMKRTELGRASRLWAESALAQAVLERAK
ncbi:MAG: ATP-binding protein, partial [Nitrospinaceae bacterium]